MSVTSQPRTVPRNGEGPGLRDADVMAPRLHDERELIAADEFESQLAFVERPRFVVVGRHDEADHRSC
jgi:hypothetical protein